MKHWFCFSFQGKTIRNEDSTACTYVGFDNKEPRLPKSEIYNQRKEAGLESGVLIAITYLGQMTREEFDDTWRI